MNTCIKLFTVSFLLCVSVFVHAGGHQNSKGVVLVAGATGGTGRLTVAKLVDEGYTVRAMVRNIEKGRKVLTDGIDLVQADVTVPETIPATLEGVDFVVSTLGTPIGAEGKATPENVDYKGTVALIDAAKAAGIKKFLLTTSGGTTWWLHPLNWFGGNVLKWKHKAELHLRASGLNHVIVRPAGGLTDEAGNTKKIIFTQKDGIPSTISREDVATTLVKALAIPEADNKTFEVLDNDDGKLISNVDWQTTFATMKVQSDNF